MVFLRDFSRNPIILLLIGVIMYAISLATFRTILELYASLGVLPFILIMLILTALPRRRKRR